MVINGFFPALWVLLTSLKSEAELVQQPISYLPQNPFSGQLRSARLPTSRCSAYLGNSFIVAGLATVWVRCWWPPARPTPLRG